MTRFLAPLAVLLAVAGCDTGESLLGEFEARIDTGDEVRAVDGEAVYTVIDGPGGPEFVLGLFVGDLFDSGYGEADYVLFRRLGGRPGVGAYAVDADPTSAVSATIARVDDAEEANEARGPVLLGRSGQLALTSIDGYGFVVGTFRFDAVGFAVEAPGRTLVGGATGRFEARYEPPSTFARIGLGV